MKGKILIFDTSILCCWLQVPGKTTCGPTDDRWDKKRINNLIAREQKAKSTFVLPVASIIETGNHIAQTSGDRFKLAQQLAAKLRDTANKTSPWAAFEHQAELWNKESMNRLADEWPKLAAQGLGIGDATIKDVAEFYAKIGYDVEILTGDEGLKTHQPAKPPLVPRRRRT
jgi:hypothetical protein